MEGKRLKLDNQPVARRTRLKEAQFFKEYYERRRKEDGKNVARPSGQSEDRGVNGSKLGRVGLKGTNMETRDLGLNCKGSAGLENRARRIKTREKVTDENKDRVREMNAKDCGDLNPEKCRDVIVIDDDDNGDEGVIFIGENLVESTRSTVIRNTSRSEGSESPVSGESSEDTDVGVAADATFDDHGDMTGKGLDKGGGLNVISRSCSRLEGCRCSLCIEQRVERIKDTEAIAADASGDDDDDCDENHDDEDDDGDVVWEEDMDDLERTSEEDNDDSDDEDYAVMKTMYRKEKCKPKNHDVNGRDFSSLEGNKQSPATTFDHHDCDDNDRIWEHDLNDLVTSSKEENGVSHNNFSSVRKTVSKKRKHMHKSHDIVKVVVNSMLEEEEMLFEETVASGDVLKEQGNHPETEPTLPLTFTFQIDESSMSKNSDSDNELHNLWVEMNFAQRSFEIDSHACNMVGWHFKQAGKNHTFCLFI